MERDRLFELALEELNRQSAGIDEEIAALRAELRSTGSAVRQKGLAPSAGTRRKRTPAQRRAHSERMKQYWARKRAQAAKPAAGSKRPAAAGAKVRTWTDAEKKALSLKLKAAWRKRKAAAAKRIKKRTEPVA